MLNFNKILKKFTPQKTDCYFYFLIPILLLIISFEYQNDLWFILNYGKYITHNGFPLIEPFTIHQNFDFIIQQWLTSIIFYATTIINFKYGLIFLCLIVLCAIMFLIYKIVMLITNNHYIFSTVISVFVSSLLIFFRFITPRPQIFDFIFLLLVIYIMEKCKNDNNTKLIYFLPLISLLQINFHSMLWFMLFIFMLPYIVELSVNRIKNKNNNGIFKILMIIGIMAVVGLMNPYGIKSILNLFTSYGNQQADLIITELMPLTLKSLSGKALIVIFIAINLLIIYNKNNRKPPISSILLFYGTFILAMLHGRSFSLFIIGMIPILASLKNKKMLISKKGHKMKFKIIYYLFSIAFILVMTILYSKAPQNKLEKGIDFLISNNSPSDIILYTNFNNGSYAEYRGLKVYIDTRAEIFYKSNNHKEDIFDEYYNVYIGNLNYKKFLWKYRFTHLIIDKNEWLYNKIKNDNNYKIIYDSKSYSIFEIK